MFLSSDRVRQVAVLASAACLAAWLATAQQPQRVTDDLLRTGSKTGEEWISYGVNWAEQRYSPLKQIDTSNVSRLGLAWSLDIPSTSGNPASQTRHEATPLIFNGVLYSIAPWSVVYAVDARTGNEIWRQDPDVNQAVWQSRICCGVVNRGIALYEDKVIAPVVDGRLRALNAADGKLLWETRVSPETQAYTITMAPRVVKGGKVIIGVSGGEYGVRGFFSAYDVRDGKLLWRFYTVPGDPSKPFEQPELEMAARTWTNDWWKIGGGAPVWNGMAYDPETDLVYVGTGQPATWTSATRGQGDNLFANTLLAVNATTGRLAWYYQEVPGDDWDYDSVADIMLMDLTINGRLRKVVMHAPKSGFFYILDRVTGEFLSADPITKISWAKSIDPKTGKPEVNPDARYKGEPVRVMPGPSGGHVWPPWSYNPNTGLVYIPGTAGGSYTYVADLDFVPNPTEIGPTGRGLMNMGMGRGGGGGQLKGKQDAVPDAVAAAGKGAAPAKPVVKDLPSWGPDGPEGNVLYAWDPIARKERWRAAGAGAGPFSGGSLSTGGNLVFSSVNDRLMAFNAATGEKLLELQTGLSQMGPPVSFMLDGKQYITVAGGPPQAGGRGGPGRGGQGGQGDASATPPQPSRMLALVLDGAPLAAPRPAEPAK
jgi:PQQ-dependent dehydrogenase (methanol/ethanol family)